MLVYIIFFLVILLLSLGISYTDEVTSKICKYMIFLFIALFTGLRSNVGTDYATYVEIFNEFVQTGDTTFHIEYGFFGLNFIVAYFHGGIIWINLFCAITSTFFLVSAISHLIDYRQYTWIAYIAFISIGLYFVYFVSGIRQGVSVSMFLYSIRYIHEKRLYRYCILIGIASLFHASVVLMLPVYFISRRKISPYIILGLVTIALIFSYSGITDVIFQSVIGLLTGHYAAYGAIFSGFANTKSGIGVILRISMGVIIVFTSKYWVKNEKHALLYNLFSFGLIFYSFFLGVDILVRISEYLLDTFIFAFPLSVRSYARTEKLIYAAVIFILLVALFYSIITYDGMNLIPYKTQFNG